MGSNTDLTEPVRTADHVDVTPDVVDSTEKIFSTPADERTEHYVTGRFG